MTEIQTNQGDYTGSEYICVANYHFLDKGKISLWRNEYLLKTC
jgi:hypothetical protein